MKSNVFEYLGMTPWKLALLRVNVSPATHHPAILSWSGGGGGSGQAEHLNELYKSEHGPISAASRDSN